MLGVPRAEQTGKEIQSDDPLIQDSGHSRITTHSLQILNSQPAYDALSHRISPEDPLLIRARSAYQNHFGFL